MKSRFQAIGTGTLSLGLALSLAPSLLANHPVFLEGNCNNPTTVRTSVASVGNCGDWDGDGKIGQDEDLDGDQVFGTLAAANSSAGANNNGTITIATSGTFAESVTLAGNITLEAVPGVSASIDAVLQGDPGNGSRQGGVGITVNAPGNRYVVIRNISIRNWGTGVAIMGNSRVLLEDVTIEHNAHFGVKAEGSAKVILENSKIIATGRRVNPGTGDFPGGLTPMKGNGVDFSGTSTGAIINTTVIGSVGTGIANNTNNPNGVAGENSTLFDNGTDVTGLN